MLSGCCNSLSRWLSPFSVGLVLVGGSEWLLLLGNRDLSTSGDICSIVHSRGTLGTNHTVAVRVGSHRGVFMLLGSMFVDLWCPDGGARGTSQAKDEPGDETANVEAEHIQEVLDKDTRFLLEW